MSTKTAAPTRKYFPYCTVSRIVNIYGANETVKILDSGSWHIYVRMTKWHRRHTTAHEDTQANFTVVATIYVY